MKTNYSQKYNINYETEEEYIPVSLRDSIEKTRMALDNAYAGFDYALEADLIDSYIYEINSLQKRYKHLLELAEAEKNSAEAPSGKHSPIRSLVSHVFG